MSELTKEQIEYQKWAWKIVDRLLAMNAVIAATDKENLRSKEEIQRELAQELSKISLSKFREAFPPSMDLALEALAMRPRPLAEIDKAETALVIERDQHSKSLNVFVLNCYGSGHWKRSPASQAWLPSTLAIPLSSLPKVQP